ncbi:MAG: hypothetical protein ACOC1O_03570 [bacterium]
MAGDDGLRKAGEQIDYTQEMINEIIKCKQDIIYFAENYYTILTIDKGKTNIELWDWQKKVLKVFVDPPDGRRNCILKIARQSGKCFCENNHIKVRNKKTGEIKEISIKEFYEKIKK